MHDLELRYNSKQNSQTLDDNTSSRYGRKNLTNCINSGYLFLILKDCEKTI